MAISEIIEVRLAPFKSFENAVLPLDDVTILTGRNSSGKSNALDAVEVLARLATGESIADALDSRGGRRLPVRGGARGCAPHHGSSFSIGCTVRVEEDTYAFDVTIDVEDDMRVVAESLTGPVVAVKSGSKSQGPLYRTTGGASGGPAVQAEVHNGHRAPNPKQQFRDNRLLLGQVAASLPMKNRAQISVHRGIEAVVAALKGVFHLDPVPHLMREFVQARDDELRRTADNLSAAVHRLRQSNPDAADELDDLVRHVVDENVQGLGTVTSQLGDVMLALREARPPLGADLTPAREMSDGLLRVVAVAAALLASDDGLDVAEEVVPADPKGHAIRGGVLVVIEELENGLHPSQAARLLDLVQRRAATAGTRVLVTTHSPALLDAAEGVLNEHIVVCHRGDDGYSVITPLTELPTYLSAMAQGSLGDAVTAGRLVGEKPPSADHSEFLALLEG